MTIYSKADNNPQERYEFLLGNIIVIEGIVGVGKTTFSESAKQYLESLGFAVSLYKEHVNADMLTYFLNDKQKHAFIMELYMTQERIGTYRLAHIEKSERVVLIDRSIPGDLAFCLMQHRRGAITAEELAIIHSIIHEQKLPSLDYVIYLDCDAQTGYKRMLARNRDGEKESYDMKYFEDLSRAYADTMQKIESHGTICIHVDWTADRPIMGTTLLDTEVTEVLDRLCMTHTLS